MNVLENSSSLDTLAFNYLTFRFLTLLNTLWTRLALSFSKTTSLKPELHPPSDEPDPVQDLCGPQADNGPAQAHVSTVVGAPEDFDGVTKGKLKFTLYYEDADCESNVTLTGEELECEWEKREGRSELWWDSWERMLRMRNGENDNGWYTCQDLTALSGNVVKFWDDVTIGSGLQLPLQLKDKDASSCVRVW